MFFLYNQNFVGDLPYSEWSV